MAAIRPSPSVSPAAAPAGVAVAAAAPLGERLLRVPPRFATRERPLPPLLEAAWSGGVAAVRAQLNAGANVNDTNDTGETALHWAAAARDVESVRALVAAGASVSAVSAADRRCRHGGLMALH